jgi:acetyl-CoA hydrolase
MDWENNYQNKIVTADEAVSKVNSGDHIFLTGNCSVPIVLMEALVRRGPELSNVEIFQSLTVADSNYVSPAMEGHLKVNTLFISPNVRKAVNEGRADFTPVLLSELPLLFKNKLIPIDIAFIHLSPPDSHGFCTLGIEAGLTKSAAEAADMIIAEINECMPRTLGDTYIHVNDIDYIVPTNYPLAELKMGEEGDGDEIKKIASHIAELIPDGATMQMGIGAIPNAVLTFLSLKKDLGVHTELFSDSVIDLVESGVLTGAKKSIHKGKIVAGFMIGTNKLYQWANNNPLIELQRTEYVNSPFTVAQNKKMVAINSAIEVDFTGQVCADSIGTKFYSGVGGQMDFIYGAGLSDGGLPIIALPSTTVMRDGTRISKIVPILKPGAGVTTTRNHVHYVATEYGIVNLYGQSIRQRTKLLISISHPKFRKELEAEAIILNYI